MYKHVHITHYIADGTRFIICSQLIYPSRDHLSCRSSIKPSEMDGEHM